MHNLIALSASWVMPTHTGYRSARHPFTLDSLTGGDHVGWIALLLQSGQRAFHEASGCRHQAQSVSSIWTLPTLQLFRWSALLTVFVGFWYWAQIYVAADAQRMGVSPLSTIGLFLLIWIGAWAILYFVISRTPSGYVVGAAVAIVVILAAWLFLRFAPVGQDDNHVLSIGIGGGFGFIMRLTCGG